MSPAFDVREGRVRTAAIAPNACWSRCELSLFAAQDLDARHVRQRSCAQGGLDIKFRAGGTRFVVLIKVRALLNAVQPHISTRRPYRSKPSATSLVDDPFRLAIR